jgi:mannosyl-oligosaccharide alpha-1,2-mannosidase
MRSLSLVRAALLLALTGHVADAAPSRSRPHRYAVNQQRADAVKEAFQVSWDGYYKYAFPHDSLRPVTNGYADDRCVSLPTNILGVS